MRGVAPVKSRCLTLLISYYILRKSFNIANACTVRVLLFCTVGSQALQ